MNMKKILSAIITIGLLASCASMNLPEQLDSFVDKAEINSEKQDDYNWEQSIEDFQALVDAYNTSDKKYTEEEKQIAARAIGRYHALLIKEGIGKSTDLIKNIGKIIPEYIDGLATELGKGAESIKQTFESMIDTSAIESSIEKLGSALESIFGPLED